MRHSASLHALAATVCCLAVTVPPPVLAAMAGGEPAPLPNQAPFRAPIIRDVALHSGGVLLGQLVNTEGSPVAGAAVTIRCRNRDVGSTTTDTDGMFALGPLHGGNYTIVAAGTAAGFRLWAPGTAPPAARDAALVVSDGRVVRGQCGPCGGCGQCRDCRGYRGPGCVGRLLRNPWVVGTLIGAAIAIPLAVADDDDDSAS